MKTVG